MPENNATKSTGSAETHARGEAQQITEDYLNDLKATRSTGAAVPETSCYPALANLFNAVGKTLKPTVRCIMTLRNQGDGLPDGGLFTADQFQKQADADPNTGQLPARGAIEAKSAKPDVNAIAATPQVKDYLNTYGIVIVTNLRDFLIVERAANGQPAPREAFSLADDEQDFWQRKTAHPRATAQLKGAQFIEFIKRACLHAAPLANPKDVAWFLASYARDALVRVEHQKSLPALQTVRSSLEEALGMKFTGDKGEHFFRSTLVQTIFYGVFSAWVRWHMDSGADAPVGPPWDRLSSRSSAAWDRLSSRSSNSADTAVARNAAVSPASPTQFDWRTAEWTLHVPFIRALYEEVAKPSRLGPLGLVEVLNWAAAVLNRVNRAEFFRRFRLEHAVQYFYEPFLEAYDPELRKAMGVWLTPREIVDYQVARVDTVLREELHLPDGLADPNVIVLDPCCGTGAYVLAVLQKIAQTLRDKGGDALVASDLKDAAMNRVYGFEIMPAPFVVSHLQLGLLLQGEGAPLSHERAERVGVYLTNALTGWEPPKGPKQHLIHFAELEEERDAAEHVKREKKILVILGNPPYNAFAGISPDEEQGLVEPYKEKLNTSISAGGWGIKKFNLDDLYVRFFRLAERRIAEMSGQGVVSFISNFSYLDDPSFVAMRQRFLAEFDKLWLDCMNGDSRETGKLTPDGKPDPSVFSTEYNREGIRVGTAVCVIVRKRQRQKRPTVRYRQFWGAAKRRELLATLNAKKFDAAYGLADPSRDNQFSFLPENVASHYRDWPRLPELSAVAPFNGPVERRGGALISVDRNPLEQRIRAYFDRQAPDHEVALLHASLLMTGNRIVGPAARQKLLAEHKFTSANIVRYPFKVMDTRWAYLANIRPLFSEPSPHLLSQRFEGNAFLISRDTADKTGEGPPFLFSKSICDYDTISGHARHFPIRLMNGHRLEKHAEATLFAAIGDKPEPDEPVANLSARAREYLQSLRFKDIDDSPTARLIWIHTLAIGYSPAYLTENADGVRRDWPRVPLPGSRKALEASAALGEELAALLDSETDSVGVTVGKISHAFKAIARITKVGGGEIDPAGRDLAISAGWGHAGKDNAVMPGKGKCVSRPYAADETAAIEAEAAARGMSANDTLRLLGDTTCDVYLNPAAYWANIPANVWNYHIGGYQVIKKWLSYRELPLLGRPLTPQEARELTNTARRIAAILLLQPQLDQNYQAVKAAAFDWQARQAKS